MVREMTGSLTMQQRIHRSPRLPKNQLELAYQERLRRCAQRGF